MTRIDKDKFIKVKKFETAVKYLSKLIQKNDGEIFYEDEITNNYNEGLKRFYDYMKLNPQKSLYEIIDELTEKGNDYNYKVTPWDYSVSYRYEDELTKEIDFFRINICFNDEYWNYIDCGYTVMEDKNE